MQLSYSEIRLLSGFLKPRNRESVNKWEGLIAELKEDIQSVINRLIENEYLVGDGETDSLLCSESARELVSDYKQIRESAYLDYCKKIVDCFIRLEVSIAYDLYIGECLISQR